MLLEPITRVRVVTLDSTPLRLYCTLVGMVTVRLAREDDLARLPGIERAAGEVFRMLGMDAVADDQPPTLEELAGCQRAGRVIVGDDDGRVVAYLLLDVD